MMNLSMMTMRMMNGMMTMKTLSPKGILIIVIMALGRKM